jgi:hypothetical protein
VKPIPVSTAKRIADTYGYDQVIVIARKVGEEPEPHGEHVTTYGVDKSHCGVAARVGNFIKHKIMDWPEHNTPEQAPSVFVKLDANLKVNRDFVASVEWDRRHYANGSESFLVVTMQDGRVHRIKSNYGFYDSVDLYAAERQLTQHDKGGPRR